MSEWPDLLDVVIVSAAGSGTDTVAIEADGVESAAARTGLEATAIWRATWALVLARLTGGERVRIGRGSQVVAIEVPGEGAVDAWLAVAAAAPAAADPTPGDPPHSAWDGDAVLAWSASGPRATCHFDRSRLDRATVERLGALLRVAMHRVVVPGARLEHVSPLSDDERALVVDAWNRTAVGYRPEATVHALFREQAASHPERIAIAWDGGRLDYGQLDRWSDALAERLIAAGVDTDQPVALCMERCPEALVAALAIMKAGGAYLPLDPQHPMPRLAFAITDAGARVLVTSRARGDALAPLASRTIFVEDAASDVAPAQPRVERATPGSRAYVMYTSGSTGTPKGVQIEHRSIVRLVGRRGVCRAVAGDAIPARGAARLRRLDARDLGPAAPRRPLRRLSRCRCRPAAAWPRAIAAHHVTTMWLTAALFNAVVDDDPRLLSGVAPAVHRRRGAVAAARAARARGAARTPSSSTATARPSARPSRPRIAIPARPAGRRDADPDRPRRSPTRSATCSTRPASRSPVGDARRAATSAAAASRAATCERPELDAERFVADPFGGRARSIAPATWCAGATTARSTSSAAPTTQVKLRGFRIELGEIETRLARAAGRRVVRRGHCATTARRASGWSPTSCPQTRRRPRSPVLRAQLATPAARLHGAGDVRDAGGPAGHRQRQARSRALPAPAAQRPELAQPISRAGGRSRARDLRARSPACSASTRSGALDGFFELGGDSLLVVARCWRACATSGCPRSHLATFFAAPTPAALARAGDRRAAHRRCAHARRVGTRRADCHHRDGRTLPRCAPTSRRSGRTSATAASRSASSQHDELDPSIPLTQRADPAYVPARGVLDDVELFDAAFFGISPLEAQLMDPQHRHFLEVVLARARARRLRARDARRARSAIFGGMYNATYYQRHLAPRPEVTGRLGDLAVMLGNEKDYVTTRVAHKLGLTGPAVSVHTACSTSLVATAMAMDSLRNGSCDIALAGGVAITCPPNSGYLHQEGAMASPDGHTRPFDATAAGHRVLRRRRDGGAAAAARRACGRRHRSTPCCSAPRSTTTAATRASFTAPSPDGQAAVIAAAHDAAGHRRAVALLRRGARHRDAARRSHRDRRADPRVRAGTPAIAASARSARSRATSGTW